MTVIAWDGKTLAGDRLGDYGGTPLRIRKIAKLKLKAGNLVLVGGAGDLSVCAAWRAWLQGKGEKPVLPNDGGFAAIIVHPNGAIFHVDRTLHPVRLNQRIHAVGSGRGEALGAMAMGADAAKAVRISAKLNLGVGYGVDVVRF